MGFSKDGKQWIGGSKSEEYMANRSTIPQVSAITANSVSQVRRQEIAGEIENGLLRDGSPQKQYASGMTSNEKGGGCVCVCVHYAPLHSLHILKKKRRRRKKKTHSGPLHTHTLSPLYIPSPPSTLTHIYTTHSLSLSLFIFLCKAIKTIID